MSTSIQRLCCTLALSAALPAACASAQVFTVGENSATAGIETKYTITHVQLPDAPLTERGRRELIRDLVGEQGFAHLALPLAAGLVLEANGAIKPGPDGYKKLLYQKGTAAEPGDRVAISSLEIKPDRLILNLNGGPYARHRFLRHVQLNGSNITGDPGELATGSRVSLVFEGGVPEVSGPEVMALLAPLLDFRAKRSEVAYAETLPSRVQEHIAAHEVLVGMNQRMVLAAMGAPESKVRESENGKRYEEWIYGKLPKTVTFVRFQGDRVTMVKTAAPGKPVQVRTADEMKEDAPGPEVRQIALGDGKAPEGQAPAAPSLLKPGEHAEEATGESQRKVQIPTDPDTAPKPAPTAEPHLLPVVD